MKNCLLSISCVLSFAAVAGTIHEVGEGKAYTDIQSAIEAANDGDEVVVAAGVYEISSEISLAKGITVRSQNGRDVTHVTRINPDNAKIARVVSIDHADAVFSGFTIRDGVVNQSDSGDWAGAGAGVRIGTNGGTLADCVVSNNVQRKNVNYAAGVASLGAAGVVTNCVITKNNSSGTGDARSYGVGVCLYGGEIVDTEISENTLASNFARGSVALWDGAKMRRCIVRGNTAPNANYYDWGKDWQATAGVYLFDSGSLIENCLIVDNVSKRGTANCGSGGGLATDPNISGDIVNCTIVHNTAGVGGGVWTKAKDIRFVNCLIQDNIGDNEAQFFGIANVVGLNNICPTAWTKTGSSGNQTGTVVFKEGTYEPIANQISYEKGTLEGCAWLQETVDLKGNLRVLDNAIDVGCYEYKLAGYEITILNTPNSTHIFKDSTLSFSANVFPTPEEATYAWTVNGETVSTAEQFEQTFSTYGSVTVGLTMTIAGGGMWRTILF